MLSENSKKDLQNLPISTVHLKDKIQLRFSPDLENKIKYLCHKYPEKEWSGPLLYEVQGSIKDASTMVITCVDIIPMDIGTKTHTEFDWADGGIVVEHMMKNEYLQNCHIGHLHSHNTMDVFFSSTDISELVLNGQSFNYYLSVIVNNLGKTIAKIGVTSQFTGTYYSSRDEDGEKYVIDVSNNEPVMLVYDCEVPVPQIVVSEEFKASVNLLEQTIKDREAAKKREEEQRMKRAWDNHPGREYSTIRNNPYVYNRSHCGYGPNKQEIAQIIKEHNDKVSKDNPLRLSEELIGSGAVIESNYLRKEVIPEIPTNLLPATKFLCYLLRFGNQESSDREESDVHDTLNCISAVGFDNVAYSDIIIDMYEDAFDEFFATHETTEAHRDTILEQITKNVIDILEPYDTEDFPFVTDLIGRLSITYILNENINMYD